MSSTTSSSPSITTSTSRAAGEKGKKRRKEAGSQQLPAAAGVEEPEPPREEQQLSPIVERVVDRLSSSVESEISAAAEEQGGREDAGVAQRPFVSFGRHVGGLSRRSGDFFPLQRRRVRGCGAREWRIRPTERGGAQRGVRRIPFTRKDDQRRSHGADLRQRRAGGVAR